jgi:cell division protein FtsN
VTRARRLRSLVIGVMAVVALLVVASRWAGRRHPGSATSDEVGGASPGPPSRAGAATEPAPDLSFYRTLGVQGSTAGRSADEAPREGAGRPAAPGRAGGAFVVQVLATRDAALAHRLRDRLATRGLPAVVSEGRAGSQPIYRVRVGRYRDRQGADAVVHRLRSEPGLTPWVLREAE